jgi:hypothetical protein
LKEQFAVSFSNGRDERKREGEKKVENTSVAHVSISILQTILPIIVINTI